MLFPSSDSSKEWHQCLNEEEFPSTDQEESLFLTLESPLNSSLDIAIGPPARSGEGFTFDPYAAPINQSERFQLLDPSDLVSTQILPTTFDAAQDSATFDELVLSDVGLASQCPKDEWTLEIDNGASDMLISQSANKDTMQATTDSTFTKGVNEHEKKLRRRAQVAISARKHRYRQKEELHRLREKVRQLQNELAKAQDECSEDDNKVIQSARQSPVDQPICISRPKVPLADIDLSSMPLFQFLPCHLSADSEQRRHAIYELNHRKISHALEYQQIANRMKFSTYPFLDIKLNIDQPNGGLRAIRVVTIPNEIHETIADAAWQSIYTFKIRVPPILQGSMTVECLEEIDENTTYGRIVMPLLRRCQSEDVIYAHAHIVYHRIVLPNSVIILLETISSDEIYPFHLGPTSLQNREIGCIIYRTEYSSDKIPNTLCHVAFRLEPPGGVNMEPHGRVTESYLSMFLHRLDISEHAARMYLTCL